MNNRPETTSRVCDGNSDPNQKWHICANKKEAGGLEYHLVNCLAQHGRHASTSAVHYMNQVTNRVSTPSPYDIFATALHEQARWPPPSGSRLEFVAVHLWEG